MIQPADISLYIPVRNSARTLAAAIAGVRAQTLQPADFYLVVDQRSTDRSVGIARRSGARIVTQHDGRLGLARNLAIRACRTRWLASCDADVTLDPRWLETLAGRVALHVAAVGGATHERPITPADRWRAVNMPHNWGCAAFDNPFMLVSEMLADTHALRAVGGYRADLQYWEDSDCCQRLRQAGLTLRYEPAAIAWHDRADSVESVLELRWQYAHYRQRERLESLDGLIAKLCVNRTYTRQSLSQTLHSDAADTLGISALLWFHHLLRDLRAALSLWPLLEDAARDDCRRALTDAIRAALPPAAAPIAARLSSLLPRAWGDAVEAPHDAAPGITPRSATPAIAAAALTAPPALSALPGFARYVEAAAAATRGLLAEWPPALLDAIADSLMRIESAQNGRVVNTHFAAPRFTIRPDTVDRLRAAPPASGGSLDVLRTLEQLLLRSGGPGSCNIAAGGDGVAIIPDLGAHPDPRSALREALRTAEWAVVSYRAADLFDPALPVLSARDLASTAAALGFAIRGFETEAGATRLVLQRAARGAFKADDPPGQAARRVAEDVTVSRA
ncbi:MAG: glycosyltransferase family 2 protein [Phycisphaerales bacterium]|nr:glycosyltransferase family 2 protein [Phycisphaerales bacterium]